MMEKINFNQDNFNYSPERINSCLNGREVQSTCLDMGIIEMISNSNNHGNNLPISERWREIVEILMEDELE